MKRCYLLLCTFIAVAVYAQQTTFIYFEDKNGLKDSLQIAVGLSNEEISAIPQYTPEEFYQMFTDSICWVALRTNSLWEDRKYERTYAYKPYSGLIEGDKRLILFPIDRMPVTISWDKQFFIDNGLTHSVMSDMPSWFDVGGGELYIVMLANSDSCVLQVPIGYTLDGIYVKEVGIALGDVNNFIEGFDNLYESPSVSKLLRDGQIIILRGDKTYTITGQEGKEK